MLKSIYFSFLSSSSFLFVIEKQQQKYPTHRIAMEITWDQSYCAYFQALKNISVLPLLRCHWVKTSLCSEKPLKMRSFNRSSEPFATAAAAMHTLRLQKRLASGVLHSGKKIWLDHNEINEITNTNSHQQIWSWSKTNWSVLEKHIGPQEEQVYGQR